MLVGVLPNHVVVVQFSSLPSPCSISQYINRISSIHHQTPNPVNSKLYLPSSRARINATPPHLLPRGTSQPPHFPSPCRKPLYIEGPRSQQYTRGVVS